MGCDGGSIPHRTEMVQTKKKEQKVDVAEQNLFRAHFCAISKELLRQPIVSCALGRLYNKESIVNLLLKRKTQPSVDSDDSGVDLANQFKMVEHVKGLKDLVELKMTVNPSWSEKEYESLVCQDILPSSWKSQFICPLSFKEMNGTISFVYMKPCGCVIAENAIKELTGNQIESVCLCCGNEFDSVVKINPSQGVMDEILKKLSKRSEKKKRERVDILSNAATKKRVGKVIDMVDEKVEKGKTKAIKEMYENPKEFKGTGLFKGTFNRY